MMTSRWKERESDSMMKHQELLGSLAFLLSLRDLVPYSLTLFSCSPQLTSTSLAPFVVTHHLLILLPHRWIFLKSCHSLLNFGRNRARSGWPQSMVSIIKRLFVSKTTSSRAPRRRTASRGWSERSAESSWANNGNASITRIGILVVHLQSSCPSSLF